MWNELSDWLAETPFSLAIQTTTWAIPSIQVVHILAIAVVLSSAMMMNLKLLNVGWRGETLSNLAGRFVRPVWLALIVLFVSGSLLVIAEPGRSLTNPVFITKMIMVACAILVTLAIQSGARRSPTRWNAPGPLPALAAVLSLSLWVLISVAGRLIAYVDSF